MKRTMQPAVKPVVTLAMMLLILGVVVAAGVGGTGAEPCAACLTQGQAPGVLGGVFDTSGFPARWHCGTGWTPLLGWLHIGSDLLIWASYMAIPAIMALYMLRRRDVPFPTVGWLFVAFIFACGTGHLIEAGMFWWPAYRLAGLEKGLTASVSVATVVALVPILPRALLLPGLARVNAQLETEVAERKRAQADLAQALSWKQQMLDRERALLRELDHRVRNNLAGLLGLIGVYERSGKGVNEAAGAIRGKVRAMIHVHELMSPDPGAPVDLASLICRLADQAVPRERRASVTIQGPVVRLAAKQAGAMAMVLQELFTNSGKHGAAAAGGSILIRWDRGADGLGPVLNLSWRDQFDGGAPGSVAEGVGFRLVRGFVSSELRGSCELARTAEGFRCDLRVRPDIEGSIGSEAQSCGDALDHAVKGNLYAESGADAGALPVQDPRG